MREMILKRIEELRVIEKGFSPLSEKWRFFYCGESSTPLSMYNFDACTDEKLVKYFERILKIHYRNGK